jgi:hypothetical protein
MQPMRIDITSLAPSGGSLTRSQDNQVSMSQMRSSMRSGKSSVQRKLIDLKSRWTRSSIVTFDYNINFEINASLVSKPLSCLLSRGLGSKPLFPFHASGRELAFDLVHRASDGGFRRAPRGLISRYHEASWSKSARCHVVAAPKRPTEPARHCSPQSKLTREIPRLWRGGSKCLTFPAVAPQAPTDETSSVSRQAHDQSPIDGRPMGEPKPQRRNRNMLRGIPTQLSNTKRGSRRRAGASWPSFAMTAAMPPGPTRCGPWIGCTMS